MNTSDSNYLKNNIKIRKQKVKENVLSNTEGSFSTYIFFYLAYLK